MDPHGHALDGQWISQVFLWKTGGEVRISVPPRGDIASTVERAVGAFISSPERQPMLLRKRLRERSFWLMRAVAWPGETRHVTAVCPSPGC